MTLERQLITSNNNTINIVSEDEHTARHFENPANFADVIINQINVDRMYDPIFEGEEGLTVLDIGANIGLFSLYIQDKARAVYSVEPTPSHFQILQELTKDYANIHPINVAVHNEDTTIDFYISEENSTMNSSVNKYGYKVDVQAKTLATIINELGLTHVDFVKCDIEGSEMVAINDATVGAVKDIVDSWYLEVHATDDDQRQGITSLRYNKALIKEMFERQGYQTQELREDALYVYKE